jgi:hypothetical protein
MRAGEQRHTPAALPPGKRLDTNFTGGWVHPKAGLEGCGKSRPSPGFDPRTVQSIASGYTDYAIPAHCWYMNSYYLGLVMENSVCLEEGTGFLNLIQEAS